MVPRKTGDPDWMATVLERASEALSAGEAPFAAAVVKGGELLACEHGLVDSTGDPTAHAEMLAIRAAAEKMGPGALSGSTIYCSCEPCPMCFGAMHFAGLTRLVYGATIGDAAIAGFGQ